MVLSFGGIDNDLALSKKAKAVIIPVPYGETVSYRKGTDRGPRAILKASDKLELFDEELDKEIYRIGINTAPPLKVKNLRPAEMINMVEEKVLMVLRQDKFPVILGGEHSVSIGAGKALKTYYKDLSILYFDAHYDLKNTYGGSRYNHACVARRLSEIARLVEAGTRSLSKDEKVFWADNNIRAFGMHDLINNPDWLESAKKHLTRDVYISIDLDVFDPSIMPSVGTPEPGGIGWYEFLKAVRDIIREKNIIGFDVVELCPIKNMVASDFTAARLVYKILGYVFSK